MASENGRSWPNGKFSASATDDARSLGTGRTPSGVEQHWQVMTGARKRNGKSAGKDDPRRADAGSISRVALPMDRSCVSHRWTVDEEARLRTLVQEMGKGKWAAVAEALGSGRSASGVEQHWQIMIGQRKRNSSANKPKAKAPVPVSSGITITFMSPVPAPAVIKSEPGDVSDQLPPIEEYVQPPA